MPANDDTNTYEAIDIAAAIEIAGLCDSTAVILLRNGRLINRFRDDNNNAKGTGRSNYWSPHMVAAADDWILTHGIGYRNRNRELCDLWEDA